MDLKNQIQTDSLPKHIAIIMDGNGRWAKQKGKLRIFGHENGAKAVKKVVEAFAEIGVKYLTLYAFSTENWNRPKLEVQTLMKLLILSLKKYLKILWIGWSATSPDPSIWLRIVSIIIAWLGSSDSVNGSTPTGAVTVT